VVRVVVYSSGATKEGGWQVVGWESKRKRVVISGPRIFELPSLVLELPSVPGHHTFLLCISLHHLVRLGIALYDLV
jgi:hypothetical protein